MTALIAGAATDATSKTDARLRDYLVGTFAFSWALWVPAGYALRGTIELPVPPTLLVVIGAFGPLVAAVVATFRHGGRREVTALLSRLRPSAVRKRWLVLALLLGAVTVLPALLFLAGGGHTDSAEVEAHLLVLPLHFLVVATIGGGLDEEVGWRGVAQPLLQQRWRPLPANLLLGVIWAVWHLPLWLDPTSAQAAYPFVLYAVVIVGHSLVTGYLYNASGGSLLVAVFAHSSNNTFDGLRYAVLGDRGGDLVWQVVLAAFSLGLGIAVCLHTRARIGLPEAPRSGR